MRIGNWNFSPGLLPSLATALVFPVLLALGLWQLDRADQKRSQFTSIMQRQADEPINLNRYSLTTQDESEVLWRRVVAYGHFDENIQILLDNQVVKSQAGYFVYTPYQLAGEKVWLLINRGWVPAGEDRTSVPELNYSTGQVLILGSLKSVPKTGILLKEATSEQMKQGVYRLQKIDTAQIGAMIDRRLMPLIIRLEPDSKFGYAREWPAPDSGEEVHMGYAFQWFALAITLIVIYAVVNLKKVGGN